MRLEECWSCHLRFPKYFISSFKVPPGEDIGYWIDGKLIGRFKSIPVCPICALRMINFKEGRPDNSLFRSPRARLKFKQALDFIANNKL